MGEIVKVFYEFSQPNLFLWSATKRRQNLLPFNSPPLDKVYYSASLTEWQNKLIFATMVLNKQRKCGLASFPQLQEKEVHFSLICVYPIYIIMIFLGV